MTHFTTLVATFPAAAVHGLPYHESKPAKGYILTSQGLLYPLSSTPNFDQLLHHRRLFKVVLNTERHLPHGAGQTVMPCELVVQHSVNSLLHSLGLTIKSMQASILVLSSKAKAMYGVDIYIWHTRKGISGQGKASVSPLVQKLVVVLRRRFEVHLVHQTRSGCSKPPSKLHRMSLRLMSWFFTINKV